MKPTILIITAVILAAFVSAAPAENKKVKLSIFYETKCPDSRTFFLRQLRPTFERLSDHIDLELIAFGKVSVEYDGQHQPVYHCQHGADECWGNFVEACVSALHTQSRALEYADCMFGAQYWSYPRYNAKSCAERLGMQWNAIQQCLDGEQSDKLMMNNWKRTYYLPQRLTFIPWVLINDQHSNAIQQGAMRNLHQLLCDDYLADVPACQ